MDCWPTREVNGAILVWYHDQKAAPDFEVPALPMGDRAAWTAPLCRAVDVSTHVQEMNENIFDLAHFVHIHHYLPGAEPSIDIDGAFAHVTLVGQGRLSGLKVTADTRSSMYGAGFTVIHVRKPVELAVIVLKTPTDEGQVRHRYGIVTPRRLPGLDGLLVRLASRQITQDVLADSTIWANKVHLKRPVLVRGDGPIMKFRKWHKQFYSEPLPVAAAQ